MPKNTSKGATHKSLVPSYSLSHSLTHPHAPKRLSSRAARLGSSRWIFRQPVADRARPRVMRVALQHFQIMLAGFGRLLQLLRVEVAQRQVCPALGGVG